MDELAELGPRQVHIAHLQPVLDGEREQCALQVEHGWELSDQFLIRLGYRKADNSGCDRSIKFDRSG